MLRRTCTPSMYYALHRLDLCGTVAPWPFIMAHANLRLVSILDEPVSATRIINPRLEQRIGLRMAVTLGTWRGYPSSLTT